LGRRAALCARLRVRASGAGPGPNAVRPYEVLEDPCQENKNLRHCNADAKGGRLRCGHSLRSRCSADGADSPKGATYLSPGQRPGDHRAFTVASPERATLSIAFRAQRRAAQGPRSGPPILMAGGSSSGAGLPRRQQDNPNPCPRLKPNNLRTFPDPRRPTRAGGPEKPRTCKTGPRYLNDSSVLSMDRLA
jgi:hypothetical protein